VERVREGDLFASLVSQEIVERSDLFDAHHLRETERGE
jgi:hypothetical protein